MSGKPVVQLVSNKGRQRRAAAAATGTRATKPRDTNPKIQIEQERDGSWSMTIEGGQPLNERIKVGEEDVTFYVTPPHGTRLR